MVSYYIIQMETGGYRCLCRLNEEVVMKPVHNDTPRKALNEMLKEINDFRGMTEEEQEAYLKEIQEEKDGSN